jgi:hypothetical protein
MKLLDAWLNSLKYAVMATVILAFISIAINSPGLAIISLSLSISILATIFLKKKEGGSQ